ncbi:peptide deformylase [Salinactinospora qingdaonensis]|uniref:peptide deformylase n=1 Tax=Salinactinospora qingdaonensis TaxID=702744 RepID=UPI0031ECF5F6
MGGGFAVEFRHWLEVSGNSRGALAKKIGYDRSYVSKIASGAEPGSLAVVAACDKEMKAGGALVRSWKIEHSHPKTTWPHVVESPADGASLIVERDHAELRFDDGLYRLTQRRRLTNHSGRPVTRYLIRIAVDRYPGRPERSNAFYREAPLTWEMLDLQAWWGEDRAEPLDWEVQHDRDAFKEVWLRFEGKSGQRFDLYPGQSAWIEYTYTVPETHWGNWFRRAVRHSTRHLEIRLDLPAHFDPAVWGIAPSMTGDDMPLESPIGIEQAGPRRVYTWSTEDPPLHARYKLEWSWRSRTYDESVNALPSQVMAGLGIVQEGDALLRKTSQVFDLPTEAEDARRVVGELHQALDRVAAVHTFGKGKGIAAPQIGIDRAAALVCPPSAEPIVLLNPRLVETGIDTDLQYEGCLSFFDTRSKIPRPLRIAVEHIDFDGTVHITEFDRGAARLVAHEVDHLHGILCSDHLPKGERPIPVEVYKGTGTSWRYSR